MTPHLKRLLGRFHHRVAHRLTVWQPQKGWYGGRFYPPLDDAMSEAGLQEIDTYVYGRQNTVSQYIVTIPIMGLCLATKRRPGPRVKIRWREYFQNEKLRGSVISGQRKRHRRGRRGQSLPMVSPSPR